MNSEIIDILTQPLERKWSVQGLGMMRTYLNDTQRLHIWNSSLMVHEVTQRHDHPWNFTSEIIFGAMHQTRATEIIPSETGEWVKHRVLCGEGGGLVGEPELVNIRMGEIETYYEGYSYSQKAHEVHDSFPLNNTVTIMTREYLEDNTHANVYFLKRGEFVSAEPRPASRAEILYITREVLHAYQES